MSNIEIETIEDAKAFLNKNAFAMMLYNEGIFSDNELIDIAKAEVQRLYKIKEAWREQNCRHCP